MILISAFFSIHSSLSQQYYSRNYTINNGLPDNCIQDLYKDSRGFLWIGTNAGLSRFDGENFNVYTSQDGLIGDKISSITESEKGSIWVGCYGSGISKLNGKEIISYNTSSGLISNEVRKIHYSVKYKILLIGTENGLTIYDNERFFSFHEKLKNVDERLQINSFIEKDDFIYVFTNGSGLYKYIPKSRDLIRISEYNTLNKPYINSAFISNNGDTLLSKYQGNLISLKNGRINTLNNIGRITDYIEDNENNIWISSWSNNYTNTGGLFKYDSIGITNFGKYLNINSSNILSLEYDDTENLLWIGTKDEGLYLYPLANFSYYKAQDFNLTEFDIGDLIADNSNNLWIATKKSIIKKYGNDYYKIFGFDLFKSAFEYFVKNTIKTKYNYLIDKDGSFEKYQQKISKGTYPFPNPYRRVNSEILPAKSLYKPLKYEILINKEIEELNSVTLDSNENIWVGSNVGIFKIDRKTNGILYFDMEGNQFSCFSMDSNSIIYGGSWADLFIYPDIVGNSNFNLFNYYEQKSPININKIKIQDDKVWFISSNRGLFLYYRDKFYSTYFDKSIEYHDFNDICFDNLGNIIIGGNNGKIYIAEFLNDGILIKFEIDKRSGLKGTSIRFLNCTYDNILIAGTNAGLNLIDLNVLYKTGKISIKTIDESKGFVDYSGQTSLIQDSTYLWIGSEKNLIKASLEQLKAKKSKKVSFYIKSIEINNEQIDIESLVDIDIWTNIPRSNFKLPYNKNSITINYDVIKFLDHDNSNFSYKLEGYHKKWIKDNNDRRIIFQNLNSGKYRLRIKVLNENDDIAYQELLLSFTILRPFWLKWWFIGLTLIFILLLIWLMIYLRSQSIKKYERQKSEISERISEFEMKALRAQMNPHFIFNVINSIQNYMLDNNVDAALNYLSDFAKLIRLTLDNVSKKQISLEEELKYLKYYVNLEQMRFDKKFEINIIVPAEFENRRFIIPSMILQPYVENSIKHGFTFKNEGGKIHLEFLVSDDNILKCIIEDNGIGRKKARELNKGKMNQSSKGTFITNERLSLLNQTKQRKGYKVEIIDLYDEYHLARGTRVEIFIPV
ncbi:MAG: histidine kinase [Bacteroidales bacterium]|nr:histidine kinase [Bacteroidales bacterium]